MLLESPYAWQVDFDSAVAIPTLVLGYLFAFGRFGAPRRRIVCFCGAVALLAVAFWTPVHHLGLHYLLSVHLLQNVILAEWSPLLLVLALSREMAAAAARFAPWRVLTYPLVALPLWLGSYFAWHVPAVYDYALRHQDPWIHVEHASYFATGILVWWPLVQDVPRRLPSSGRVGYAFAAFMLGSPLGLLLALLPRAVYSYYEHAPRLWGLSPLTDQELGGASMASEQAIVLFAVFAYWFRRFLIEEGAM